ncbi:MAG: glycosyltransferase family 39 protein [Candidatus Dormiibacterota bacterium]
MSRWPGDNSGSRSAAPGEHAETSISRWRRWRSLTVPLTLLLVLRLPSLFEPHWYTDEAGYANVAWEMLHGKVLFLTTWNNKPPLLFWIYQLGLLISGPTEFGIHLLSIITEAVALVGTWVLARNYLSPRRVWIAMLIAAFFLATPVFNGDLALPENLLIGFTVWAMVAVVAATRTTDTGRATVLAAVAGVLFAGAILIQQSALADLAAALLVLLLVSRRGWLQAAAAGVSASVVVVVVMTPFVIAAGMHNVVFFLITGYSGYTQNQLPLTFWSLLPRAVAGVLILVGAYSARKWPAERLLLWVWLASVLLFYVIPNRDYAHFLLPAVPAASLLLSGFRVPNWRAWRTRVGLAGAPLLAAVVLATGLWAGLFLGDLVGGSLFTVKLTGEYYPAFVGKLTGALTPAQYVAVYDQRAVAEYQAVTWIKKNNLTGSTAVVWSADSWAYLLGRLDPILPEPTIYMNYTLLGSTDLLHRVQVEQPVVVILTSDAYTAFGPIIPLLERSYTEVEESASGQLWIRSDVASKVLAARSEAAVANQGS